MSYQQIAPPAKIAKYIKSLWVYQSEELGENNLFRLSADGCPGLIFQHDDAGFFYKENKKLPTAFLYGQATKFSEIQLYGKFNTIGIYFHPNALKSIFGLDAQELTDSCTAISQINSKNQNTSELFLNAKSVNNQIEIVCKYLSQQIDQNKFNRACSTDYALQAFASDVQSNSYQQVLNKLALTQRTFERKFLQRIGISPQLFLRISRFQKSVGELKSKRYEKLSDIAFRNGYSDQSHFIRNFKEFAGISPNRFRQEQEIVKNLSISKY
ncbi:AraC family transcriptional regulator [Pedobacter yonginense]|uniref:AraC family transcriptional regulator n=1 Tax=Pedobacter yonginense TaxID=651869 RepID=A0A317EJT7_9SPHI|nr:helix-turn-helix domain-containing protein [Pedobacter yonginense]PWS26123.1 AraC family transcriptional regulator [Pedobacter yonginense]